MRTVCGSEFKALKANDITRRNCSKHFVSECTRPSGASPRYLYQTKFTVEATALRRAGI